jgi:hypothetical protein
LRELGFDLGSKMYFLGSQGTGNSDRRQEV